MIQRYKITIEYDGAGYSGWQKQADVLSIQEAIETAIYKFTSEEVEVYGSGRTDRGVNAFGQVAHFDLEDALPKFTVMQAMNFYLKSAKISVLDCQEVDQGFHARFSATKRSYKYFILNRHSPTAFTPERAWHVRAPLDIEKMQKAAKLLEGTHDFSSFRTTICQAPSPIKTLDYIRIYKDLAYNIIIFEVGAKSFLHHMVRNIVGCLKMIGTGQWQETDLLNFLHNKDVMQHKLTAPACGLYLDKILFS